MARRVPISEASLEKALERSLRENREVEVRTRFELAQAAVRRHFPDCRFAGLTSRGFVYWPGRGKFHRLMRLDGAGLAWIDDEHRFWVWQPF